MTLLSMSRNDLVRFPGVAAKVFFSRVFSALTATVAGLALTALSLPALAAWDVQQLMDSLAQNKSSRAAFVEKKYIAVLDRPIESSGELVYTAPDGLEKLTFKPRPEAMVVKGDELAVKRGKQQLRLQLRAYPELAAFIDSIRGTLAGDRKALERNYRLSLEGAPERWTLRLLPLEEKTQAVVQRIVISGVRERVRSIEIVQADGDRSVMAIENAASP